MQSGSRFHEFKKIIEVRKKLSTIKFLDADQTN